MVNIPAHTSNLHLPRRRVHNAQQIQSRDGIRFGVYICWTDVQSTRAFVSDSFATASTTRADARDVRCEESVSVTSTQSFRRLLPNPFPRCAFAQLLAIRCLRPLSPSFLHVNIWLALPRAIINNAPRPFPTLALRRLSTLWD